MEPTQARLAAAVYIAQCQRKASLSNYARGVVRAAYQIGQLVVQSMRHGGVR
jgi:hypothetical protein